MCSSDLDVASAPSTSDSLVCTGSKDKTISLIAVSSLDSSEKPLWRSHFHTAKVGAVKLQGSTSTMVASASDDGIVALHDYRMNGGRASESSSYLVAKLEGAHDRPHSVLWDPHKETNFVTAGLDPIIKIWDHRNLSKPVMCLHGHVPTSTMICKKIHRPTFFFPAGRIGRLSPKFDSPYLLTGGQGSASVSMYRIDCVKNATISQQAVPTDFSTSTASLFSRGKLPINFGDAGCIAVNGKTVAVAVGQGEIIILEPSI